MTYQPHNDEDWNDYNDLAVGEILRRTRMHYGQTLEQVEFSLRIRASQLQALEEGDVTKLPGRVYAIGFVRTYSEYLGLDGDRMVHLFKNQSVGNKTKADLHFPTIAKESQVPSAPYIWGGLAAAAILILCWILFWGRPVSEVDPIPRLSADPDQNITQAPAIGVDQSIEGVAGDEASSVTESTEAEGGETGTSLLQPPPEQEQASLLIPPPKGVVIQTLDNSWVEIRDASGKIVLSQILQAGDEYKVPDGEGYILTTGNAGGLKILVEGQDAPPLGAPAQVRRNISLNPQDLLSAQ